MLGVSCWLFSVTYSSSTCVDASGTGPGKRTTLQTSVQKRRLKHIGRFTETGRPSRPLEGREDSWEGPDYGLSDTTTGSSDSRTTWFSFCTNSRPSSASLLALIPPPASDPAASI